MLKGREMTAKIHCGILGRRIQNQSSNAKSLFVFTLFPYSRSITRDGIVILSRCFYYASRAYFRQNWRLSMFEEMHQISAISLSPAGCRNKLSLTISSRVVLSSPTVVSSVLETGTAFVSLLSPPCLGYCFTNLRTTRNVAWWDWTGAGRVVCCESWLEVGLLFRVHFMGYQLFFFCCLRCCNDNTGCGTTTTPDWLYIRGK